MPVLRDLRLAYRALLRRPGYTFGCVATLGLATGVGFAAMMVADAVLLRPPALSEPERVRVFHRGTAEDVDFTFLYPEWERVRDSGGAVFKAVAASGDLWAPGTGWSVGDGVQVSFVTDGYFDAVGVRPALGRGFLGTEHRVGADPVAIVTDAFWRSRLSGDRNAIGRRIEVGEASATVVGVMPAGFRGLRRDQAVDAVMPLRAAQVVWPLRNLFGRDAVAGYSPERWIRIVARLADGEKPERGESWLATVWPLRAAGGEAEDVIGTTPARLAALPGRSRSAMRRLFVVVAVMSALVLLAGCASVAGAMLVRSGERRHEMAIRVFIGATRAGLVGPCLAETALLTGAGSLVGGLVAVWLLRAVGGYLVLPGGIDIADLDVDWTTRMTVICVLTSVMVVAVVGMVPVLQSMGMAMRGRGWRGQWPGAVLAGQVAAATVLMIGASLSVRGIREVVDMGLDLDRLLYVKFSFWNSADYRSPDVVADFYDRVLRRMDGLRGVEAATFGDLPLVTNAMSIRDVHTEGAVRRLPRQMQVFFCGPDYAEAVGLGVVAGRDFGSDDRDGGVPVAMVTESLARRLWEGGAAVGRRLGFLPLETDVEVVGVVRDGRYGTLRDGRELAIFLPWDQHRKLASATGALVVRADQSAGALVPMARQVIRAVAPGLTVGTAATFRGRMESLLRPQQAGAVILGGLAVFALVLTVVGVYGAVAHVIAVRRRELGVRIALGAGIGDIVRTALRGTSGWVVVGVAIGLGVASTAGSHATRVVGDGAADPVSHALGIGAVVAVAATAGLVPALQLVSTASQEKLIRETMWAE